MSDQPTVPTTAESVDGLIELAKARAQAGDAAGAGRTFAAALHLAELHGLYGPTARAQTWLAGVDVKNGKLALARQRLDLAWQLCQAHDLSAQVRGEVGAQLGQVLVFQGHAGAGAALMYQAISDLQTAGQSRQAEELELALAAVCSRVDRAVDETPPGSIERVHALLRRARTRLGVGQSVAARADLCTAWDSATQLPNRLRAHIGHDYGKLLVAAGPQHAAQARAVLQAARMLSSDDPERCAELDALLADTAMPAR